MIKMATKICSICGKEIEGNNERHAEAQLENHKVTHGEANRLTMRKREKKELKKNIHEKAIEVLKEKKVASTQVIRKRLLKDTLKKGKSLPKEMRNIDNTKVGIILSKLNDIDKRGGTRGGRGSTWELGGNNEERN